MSHYFENDEHLKSEIRQIKYTINGITTSLYTDIGVFSKNGIDYGTLVLLKTIIPYIDAGKVLDIGCGYGAIGLTLAIHNLNIHVQGVDVNERALSLFNKNACALGLSQRVTCLRSDVYEKIEGEFEYIVSNPPIRAGKRVTYRIYDEANSYLKDGGKLFLVVRKQQGAPSVYNHLKELFKSVEVVNKDKGYWIIIATK
jgi:16S rRNA (guanine1207-N2)-methyltransferase